MGKALMDEQYLELIFKGGILLLREAKFKMKHLIISAYTIKCVDIISRPLTSIYGGSELVPRSIVASSLHLPRLRCPEVQYSQQGLTALDCKWEHLYRCCPSAWG